MSHMHMILSSASAFSHTLWFVIRTRYFIIKRHHLSKSPLMIHFLVSCIRKVNARCTAAFMCLWLNHPSKARDKVADRTGKRCFLLFIHIRSSVVSNNSRGYIFIYYIYFSFRVVCFQPSHIRISKRLYSEELTRDGGGGSLVVIHLFPCVLSCLGCCCWWYDGSSSSCSSSLELCQAKQRGQ